MANRCLLHIFDKTPQFVQIFSCDRCVKTLFSQTNRLLVKLMFCVLFEKRSQFQVISELSLLCEQVFAQTAQFLVNFMSSARF